jgi:hypothetical protein
LTLIEKRNLYNEAIAFFELAECGRKYIPEQKHIESHIPYIVNMTFCTELLLKLLLIEKGKNIKEVEKLSHNIKLLYNELSLEIKELIYHSFKRPLIYKIEEELEQLNKAFVDWRYLVLNKAKGDTKKLQIHPYFLKEFNEILINICKI